MADDFARSLLQKEGQGKFSSQQKDAGERGIYPAIVVNTQDPANQGRITARIINLDKKGNTQGGKDRDKTDDQLKWCLPFGLSYFWVKPQKGEMVFVVMENGYDETSSRFFIGPITTSLTKLSYQSYSESVKIYDYSKFNLNASTNIDPKVSAIFPTDADVSILGRNNSLINLRPSEVYATAGYLSSGNTLSANVDTPSYIQLIQKPNSVSSKDSTKSTSLSQANIISNNINLYSNKGSFRSQEISTYEINSLLEFLDKNTQNLHPVVFGDELVKLLDLIIRLLLNHIHTPQKPLLETPESKSLTQYTVQGALQNILSKIARVN